MFGHARRTCLLGTAGTRVYALSLHDALPILRVGATVESGPTADIKPGNALPLVNIPTGTLVHNVELKPGKGGQLARRSEEHTSELQSHHDLVCRLLLEKKNHRRAAGEAVGPG